MVAALSDAHLAGRAGHEDVDHDAHSSGVHKRDSVDIPLIVPPRAKSLGDGPERLRLRADAGRRPLLRVIVAPHGGDDVVAVDGVDALEHLVHGEDGLLQEDGPPQRLHARARALHAQHELPLEVVLGARDGVVRHVRLEVAQHVEDDAHGLLDRLLPRAEVDGGEAGVGVQRGVRVHGVGEAALLAHLLEEVRAPRAAEDGVDDEDGVAVRVAALGARTAEAHVVLLGVLLREPGHVAVVRDAELRAPHHGARLGPEVRAPRARRGGRGRRCRRPRPRCPGSRSGRRGSRARCRGRARPASRSGR